MKFSNLIIGVILILGVCSCTSNSEKEKLIESYHGVVPSPPPKWLVIATDSEDDSEGELLGYSQGITGPDKIWDHNAQRWFFIE